jgi:dihydropteroate synthase
MIWFLIKDRNNRRKWTRCHRFEGCKADSTLIFTPMKDYPDPLDPLGSPTPHLLNCRGRLLDLARPQVMGILNLTPDSFSDGGRYATTDSALQRVGEMLAEGARIIDIGGASSRPGAPVVSPEDEWQRIAEVVLALPQAFPEAILSIDTFHASVAEAALAAGAHIINDISAGQFDPRMLAIVAQSRAPFVLMHMQGSPATMQQQPHYEDVVAEVYAALVARIRAARSAGIVDLILDPGFGFGKTLAHNYELFRNLDKFNVLGLPVLVGISRKSMVYKLFSTQPEDVLEITTALHLKALEMGAAILRVHDVRPAYRAVQMYEYLSHGTL